MSRADMESALPGHHTLQATDKMPIQLCHEPPSMNVFQPSWTQAWSDFGSEPPPDLLNALLSAYSEPPLQRMARLVG